MRRLSIVVLVVGCSVSPSPAGDDTGDDTGGDPGGDPPPFTITDATDADGDQIPDQLEDHLMDVFGPVLRLPPDDIDWTRPANVDWFLPQVHLRFDHVGCPDDEVLAIGAVTFANLAAQEHYTKASGLGLCKHNTDPADLRRSSDKALEFFLQPADDDAVHPGIPPSRKSEWRVYTQVRPSSYVRGDGKAAAYDLQVWYFFAYNDATGPINHEADWEHMTLSIDADLGFVSAYFAAHDGGHRFDDPAALKWNGDHVIAYLADGSHATYESPGTHPGPVVDDHTYDGGPAWHTWENYKNLGEKGHILNGQTWAKYGGRWGEVGAVSGIDTDGPPGPMFQGSWNTANEYKN